MISVLKPLPDFIFPLTVRTNISIVYDFMQGKHKCDSDLLRIHQPDAFKMEKSNSADSVTFCNTDERLITVSVKVV